MKAHITYVAVALGLVALAQAKEPTAPGANVPASLQVPAGEKVILRTHATGSQIYVCGAGSDGKPQWTLKAPEADLHDKKGKVVAHHFAGPTWKYTDGSEVKGKAVAHEDSPDAKSIQWLLLTATDHTGEGLFSRVTSIQRLNTQGGKPPATACDPSQPTAETRSSYTADYYFWAKP